MTWRALAQRALAQRVLARKSLHFQTNQSFHNILSYIPNQNLIQNWNPLYNCKNKTKKLQVNIFVDAQLTNDALQS
jgi:hypothetical protein